VSDSYPQGTVEWVPLNLTKNGTLVTSGVAASVVPDGQRPGTWTACTLVDGYACTKLTGTLATGTYRVWAQVTTADETAILDCGTITIA
jgi:hypothetical protein